MTAVAAMRGQGGRCASHCSAVRRAACRNMVGAANVVASRSVGGAAAVAVLPDVVAMDIVTHDVAAELSGAGRKYYFLVLKWSSKLISTGT